MKKTIKALKPPFILLVIIFSFIACDKDFSEIESDVLGEGNSNFTTGKVELPIISYNENLDLLQIDNLISNLLGVYKDPAFGTTTASIVTQVIPTSFNPNFGTNAVIDSVILKIPYYSRVYGTDFDGNPYYTINDSVYGEEFDGIKHPINLSIYQIDYFLNFDGSTNYYSLPNGEVYNKNTNINFDNSIVEALRLDNQNNDPIENIELTPSINSIYQGQPPSIYYKLQPSFWKALIIDKQGDAVLSNANNFKNYFRGLYFKAETKDSNGSMMMLNMNSTGANIKIYYKSDDLEENTQSSYTLNFLGNRVNPFISNYDTVTFEKRDTIQGNNKLYLKGIDGSMAVVKLFEDDNALNNFKNEYRIPDGKGGYKFTKLINDAQLIIFEDEMAPNNGYEDLHKYDRIYAYDVKNNIPIIDYVLDPTQNLQKAYNSKIFSLGQRFKDADGRYKYKIRLTEHIKNIILNDSTNTKIGLVLSTNVNYTVNSEILKSVQTRDTVRAIPTTSLMAPRGTILYGNSTSDPNKKIRLDLFITEPK